MARLILNTTGNFNAASFGVSDATALSDSEAANTALTTSYVASSSFTPGAITIDAILVKVATIAASPTGTISVNLRNVTDGADVVGTEVTLNVSDLGPASAGTTQNEVGWIAFKFANNLLVAGKAYAVQAKTSSSSQVNLYSAATTNWSRQLRTTATGTPAAGDIIDIIGEHTGAGTGNNLTCTYDLTATTDFGPGTDGAVAMTIGKRGTLTSGVASTTAYYLKLSGNLIGYNGGTFNVGSSGGRMPTSSSFVLEFDPVADGGMGFIRRNGFTSNMYGATKTCITLMTADKTSANSVIALADTTGWQVSDELAFAPTSRTSSQGEKKTILTVDSSVQVTLTANLTNSHSGTSPTQAEVGNMTRNVKIRSATSTITTFVVNGPTAVINDSYIEIYYASTNTTGKRGYEINTTTGSLVGDGLAIHDCESWGLITSSTANNFTLTNLVFYNCGTVGQGALAIAGTTGSAWTVDDVLIVLVPVGSGFTCNDWAGVVTDITIAGVNGDACSFNDTAGVVAGTLDRITIHSNNGIGQTFSGDMRDSTMNTWKIWRNNSNGFKYPLDTNFVNINLIDWTLFGNATSNARIEGNIYGGTWKNMASNGDTTFSTADGVLFANNTNPLVSGLFLDSCSFSVASGIKTAHTNDFNLSNGNVGIQIVARNTFLSGTNPVAAMTTSHVGSFFKVQALGQAAAVHRTYMKYGTITLDSTIFSAAAPSERLTPNNASNKLTSGIKEIAVASGATLTPSVKVRESVVGDGTDYNGNRIRLIVKANPAAGITTDTVLATATAASEGAWETISGATGTVTDDAVLEFYVDCDGTTGWINDDDWTVT